jgi:hypothetical protein
MESVLRSSLQGRSDPRQALEVKVSFTSIGSSAGVTLSPSSVLAVNGTFAQPSTDMFIERAQCVLSQPARDRSHPACSAARLVRGHPRKRVAAPRVPLPRREGLLLRLDSLSGQEDEAVVAGGLLLLDRIFEYTIKIVNTSDANTSADETSVNMPLRRVRLRPRSWIRQQTAEQTLAASSEAKTGKGPPIWMS